MPIAEDTGSHPETRDDYARRYKTQQTLQDLSETALWTRAGKSSNECSTKPYEKLLSAHTDMLTPICFLACHGHFVSLQYIPHEE